MWNGISRLLARFVAVAPDGAWQPRPAVRVPTRLDQRGSWTRQAPATTDGPRVTRALTYY